MRAEGALHSADQQELGGGIGQHDPEVRPRELRPVGDAGGDEGVGQQEERPAHARDGPEPGACGRHRGQQQAVARDGDTEAGGQIGPQEGDGDDEGEDVRATEPGRRPTHVWRAMRRIRPSEEQEIADVTGREGGHPHEEGRVGVGQQQYVAAPAAEQGGHQEPRSAAYDRVGGEQGHQKRLGDQVPRGEPDGQETRSTAAATPKETSSTRACRGLTRRAP